MNPHLLGLPHPTWMMKTTAMQMLLAVIVVMTFVVTMTTTFGNKKWRNREELSPKSTPD
jgi:hypothetical protein